MFNSSFVHYIKSETFLEVGVVPLLFTDAFSFSVAMDFTLSYDRTTDFSRK